MQSRMKNPALVLPDAVQPIQAVLAAARESGAPEAILELVHLRASQINGCSFCVDLGGKQSRKSGLTDQQLATAVAWRDAPYFSDAERAALALAEAATRLADRSDPVPDEIWDEATKHYDEKQLAGIVLMIAVANLFNRVNVTTRQVAGTWAA